MRNNRLSFFKHFTKSETDIILKNCVEMDFEANDIIFKKGSKKFSGAIIINEGTIDCFDDKSDLPINGFSKGEYFNFSSNLFSNERAFTAVAKEKTKILFIDKLKINDLCKDVKMIMKLTRSLKNYRLKNIIPTSCLVYLETSMAKAWIAKPIKKSMKLESGYSLKTIQNCLKLMIKATRFASW